MPTTLDDCANSSSVWITNVVRKVTNGTVNLTFTIAGGTNGAIYDVFAIATLPAPLSDGQWAWMGQGSRCQTFTLTNLPAGTVYVVLGTPQDSDGDGLTDAYELLVSHTDPNNPDTYGTGMSDGWQLAYFGMFNVDFYAPCTYLDGWNIGQAYQNGWSPFQYHTPPAPTGLMVNYCGPNTNLFVTWNAAILPPISYTVERSIPALNQTNFFTNTATALIDNLPSGSVQVGYAAPSYRVMTQFRDGPSSWTSWVSIFDSALFIDADVVRGAQGHLYLVAPAVPPNVATLHVSASPIPLYDYFWQNSYPITYEANYLSETPQNLASGTNASLDVPVSSLQNGAYELPPWLAPPYSLMQFTVQAIGTDGRWSDTKQIWDYEHDYVGVSDLAQPGAIPFLDGREQIGENVQFLLRAAKGVDECTGTDETFNLLFSGSGWQVLEQGSHDYAYAGFHYYDADSEVIAMDVLRPFEQNYIYANFVYASSNVDGWGFANTGVFPSSGLSEFSYGVSSPTNLFLTFPYASIGGTNAIPAKLSSGNYRWIYIDLYDLGGIAGPDCSPNDPWIIPVGYKNVYGLNLKSILSTTNYGPAMTVTSIGQQVPDTTFGDFFYEMDQPQLSTVGYYFGRPKIWASPNADPRPGEPDFQVNATTPTMMTPFGKPMFVSAWAKQAILNGYTNKFAFAEQYFDTAYTTDTNGVATTNVAGVLSPYGEFFPTMPGQIALVTMPDINYPTQRGTGIVNVIKLQLDVNHDGIMDLSFGGPDNTSPGRPFMFWVNNNYDRSAPDSADPTSYDDDVPSSSPYARLPYSWTTAPDCEFRTLDGTRAIPSQRDLQDFARLWVCGVTSNALSSLPPGTTVTLSWDDAGNPNPANPTIDLFQAAELDGGICYLTNSFTAARQLTAPYIRRLGPGSNLVLNASELANGWAGNYFIWCGVSNGAGALTLTISQGGTNTFAKTTTYIQLQDIKQMYERWTVGDRPSVTPTNTPHLATEGVVQPFNFNLPADTNTPYVLYVHGWNLEQWEKDRFAESAFKRLYWQGYRGRFGLFRWPTSFGFTPNLLSLALDRRNYDNSELNAWRSGLGLLYLLGSLDEEYPGHVYLLAHSMGNVVAGEALRYAGSGELVNTYVASQAAIPAHVYDGSMTNSIFTPIVGDPVTPNIYTNYLTSIIGRGAGKVINFYNTNDYALQNGRWELNQVLKPDQSITVFGGNYIFGLHSRICGSHLRIM